MTITSESLPESLRQAATTDPMGALALVSLDEMVERYVARVLEHTNGNHTQAAAILGISRRTLHRMAERKRSAPGSTDSDTKSQGDHI